MTSRGQTAIIADGLQPPPDGIATVETSVGPSIKQVWNQSVAQATAESQNDVARLLVAARQEEETAQRNESVSAPVAHVTDGKVRQTCTSNKRINAC